MTVSCTHSCDFRPDYESCCLCRNSPLICDRCAKRWERSTPLQKWKVVRRRVKDRPPLPGGDDTADQDLFYKHCRRPPCNHPDEPNCDQCNDYIDNEPSETLDALVDSPGRVP